MTAADIAAGNISITDIVMPVPGHMVTYPTHAVGRARVDELLAGAGLKHEDFEQPKFHHLRLVGAYRKMVVVPSHVESSIFHYSSPTVSVYTPLSRLA